MTDSHFECGGGWDDIIKPVLKKIEEYNNKHEEKIEVLQIKEKFGLLRIYLSFYPENFEEVCADAENESSQTCEFCGTKQNVYTNDMKEGWMKTLCVDCRKERNEKRSRVIWES